MGTRSKMTDASATPAWLAAIPVDKIPEPYQTHAKKVVESLSNPEEAKARAQALAMSALQIWAMSSAPIFALFCGLLTLLEPDMALEYCEPISARIKQEFNKQSTMVLAAAPVGVIVVLSLLSWFNYWLSWIVTFLWMAMAVFFAAEIVLNNYTFGKAKAE